MTAAKRHSDRTGDVSLTSMRQGAVEGGRVTWALLFPSVSRSAGHAVGVSQWGQGEGGR